MKPLAMPEIGKPVAIEATAPLTVSARPSLTPRMINAGRLVHWLFEITKIPDVGDPESFLSAATAIFADYAPEIGEAAVPILAKKSDYPTLRMMSEVLDELNGAALERQRRSDGHRKALPHLAPRAKRTPEEQATADAQCAEIRKAFGLKNPETNDAKTG
jgi:hypothetical protein